MRRDITHFYERSLAEVFSAYDKAIRTLFKSDPKVEPYHTISFGLAFSFTYNMNGGACYVRFMPYDRGTAVNVRYSIVQLMAARYVEHDDDMTRFVEQELGVQAYSIEIPVEVFLDPRNQYVMPGYSRPIYQEPNQFQAPNEVLEETQNQSAPQANEPNLNSVQYHFCPECGCPLEGQGNFCPNCGYKLR